MRIAMQDLKLYRLLVAYPGERRYQLAKEITVMGLAELISGSSG